MKGTLAAAFFNWIDMSKLHPTMALVLAIMSCAVLAADEPWKLEKSDSGIQVHSRAVEGWTLRETRGTISVHARLSSLVAAITDTNIVHELNDVVRSASIRQHESDTRYQIYSVMAMPWPLADRDILNQREIRQDPDKLTVTIADVAAQGLMPSQEGRVRIVKSRQLWTLTPLEGGTVAIEMRTLADPAGPIPTSLINAMSGSMPFNTLRKLRDIAQREPYANARLAFIKEAGQ